MRGRTIRVWWSMVREKGWRRGCAESLRWLADRLAPEDAFAGGGMTVYLIGRGWVVDPEGRRGTPVWFRRCDYDEGWHWPVLRPDL